MSVPGPAENVLRTCSPMPRAAASSTARECSTRAPANAISTITSMPTAGSSRAAGTTRGSEVNTPSTSVQISQCPAPRAAASATAVVSEPPRPRVSRSPAASMPWNPATTGTSPAARCRWMRAGSTAATTAAPGGPDAAIPA
jgi:hypothetical protein